MNAAPSLSHTFSPQSIDEKVFAHVLRVWETERGLVVESLFLFEARVAGRVNLHFFKLPWKILFLISSHANKVIELN